MLRPISECGSTSVCLPGGGGGGRGRGGGRGGEFSPCPHHVTPPLARCPTYSPRAREARSVQPWLCKQTDGQRARGESPSLVTDLREVSDNSPSTREVPLLRHIPPCCSSSGTVRLSGSGSVVVPETTLCWMAGFCHEVRVCVCVCVCVCPCMRA